MNPGSIASELLRWYEAHARILPWRAPPGAPRTNPYRVWLSEIMLQQTTVAAVQPYFAKFIENWPTVEALAAADDDDVMAAWAGLGYYARARNLIACAKIVAEDHGGRFPETETALRDLPGIGDYTAAAIAAIAFGEAAIVVDANIERVIARLETIDTPLPKARREIRAAAETLTPPDRAGDFAQAMMDLGAAICTSRNPACGICPLSEQCAAAASGEPEAWPVRKSKGPKPQRHGTAYWLEHQGDVLLVRRPGKGMLGGMRALPSDNWCAPAKTGAKLDPPDWAPVFAGALSGPRRVIGTVDHVFTHFALTLDVVTTKVLTRPDIDGEWWPVGRIEEAGLPTLFAKAAKLARALEEETE